MYIDRESIAIYYNYTNRDRFLCICNRGYFWSIYLEKCLPLENACSIYNPCGGENRGKCTIVENKNMEYLYECVCHPAFTGQFCQIATNPCSLDSNKRICSNTGECMRDSSHIKGFRCQCLEGYVAKSISDPTCIDLNECNSYLEVCKNGGTCENSMGSYECHCGLGFSGKNCDLRNVTNGFLIQKNYGEWNGWSHFEKCSVGCGFGLRRAYRNCSTPYRCSGSNSKVTLCENNAFCQNEAYSELIGSISHKIINLESIEKLEEAYKEMMLIYERFFLTSSNITHDFIEVSQAVQNSLKFKKYLFLFYFYKDFLW